MKAVTKPYKLFGRQCKCCGTYFLYTFQDALTSPYCPTCYSPFEHSVDDPEVQIDPNIAELRAQQKLRDAALDSAIIPEFSAGESVYAIYKDDKGVWRYGGETVVERIIYIADLAHSQIYYKIPTPIHGNGNTLAGDLKLFKSLFSLKLSKLLTTEELAKLPSAEEEEDDEDV